MTGQVIEFKWDSTNGYTYTISSKYYDIERNDMVDGIKICREAELVDMSSYSADTEPVKPDKVVGVTDKVEPEVAK